jgi:N6-adenosine-specific RNA methylase IME4
VFFTPLFGLVTRSCITNSKAAIAVRKYQTILIDPPWEYAEGWPAWANTSKERKPLPYESMSIEQIKALPVSQLLKNEGYCFLWTTNRYLETAFAVVRAWGFTPKQTITWCKEPNGEGPGGMFSTTTEFLIVAQKIREGTNAHGRRTKGRVNSSWFVFKRGRHSEKPSGFIELLERVSEGPYLELFAREKRLGWDCWGNEVPSDIDMEAIAADYQTSNFV